MADKITSKEVTEILEQYQLYRKGKVDWFSVSPSKLTHAINFAIEELKVFIDEEHIQVLEQYQLWRTGEIDWFPVSPSKLTQAINISIEALKGSAKESE